MPRKKKNPYYLVLRSISLNERLPTKDEAILGGFPEFCLQYALHVIGGRLPDHLHNKIVLGVWESEDDRDAARKYLDFAAGNSRAV